MEAAIKSIKRGYSEAEKRRICESYKESGLSQGLFCREVGISKSALGKWRKQFSTEFEANFFELKPLGNCRLSSPDLLEVKIHLLNQLELTISIKEINLILIQKNVTGF